jgi:hypothetical protein
VLCKQVWEMNIEWIQDENCRLRMQEIVIFGEFFAVNRLMGSF